MLQVTAQIRRATSEDVVYRPAVTGQYGASVPLQVGRAVAAEDFRQRRHGRGSRRELDRDVNLVEHPTKRVLGPLGQVGVDHRRGQALVP